MDPEAFILDHRDLPLLVIMQIPDNPPESFAADAINQLLGKCVTPERLTYQAD